MKKLIKEWSWCLYLGVALAAIGHPVPNIEFFIVDFGTIFLVMWSKA